MSRNFSASAQDQEKTDFVFPAKAGKTSLADYKVPKHVEIYFLRFEVPVHRHRISAEPHRAIGRSDEGDVVAHQHANAVALIRTMRDNPGSSFETRPKGRSSA